MKANKTLEKIYIDANEDWNRTYTVFTEEAKGDNIEYVRTNAFIEKAKKWFEKQNEWHDMNGNKHCDMESFEDFRKYMEGE